MKKYSISLIFISILQISFSQNILQLTASQFHSILKEFDFKNSVIIDSRDSLMFQTEHIKNAINIDANNSDVENLISKFNNKKIIAVYCTTHNRTNKIIEILKKLNYNGQIIDITDGITGWKSNGFETFTQKKIANNLQPLQDTIFKPSGKIIIQVFGNFDYNATQNIDKKFSFWFGRAHFGYEYQYNKNFSAKIIIDAGRPTTIGTITVLDSNGNNLNIINNSKQGAYYTINLKFASLEWKPSKIFKIQAGAVLQNHYITQEKFWGFRYLAETFQDRYYKLPSADLGFITYIKPNNKLAFDFALTNGEGFRFDQDNYGDIKIAAGTDLNFVKNLQTRLYYHNIKSKNPSKPAIEQLFSGFAGYKIQNKFRIGAEYNYLKNNLNITNQDLFGYSIYASVTLLKNFEFFARYDNLMSNTKTNETIQWNYNQDGQAIISGIHTSPISNINFSINYQSFIPENSDIKLQNHILISFEYKL